MAGLGRRNGDDDAPDEAFKGKRFPTFLHWANRGDGDEIEKHCPINGGCSVELRTDAENAFLTRPDAPGICIVEPHDWFVSHELTDGNLKVRMRVPDEGVSVGDQLPLSVRLLADDALVSEFVAEGLLVVDRPTEASNGGGSGGGSTPAQQLEPLVRE